MSNEKTIRMPKELLEKWLAALRSGEYKQATSGVMRDRNENSFCCLAVLQHAVCGKVVEADDEYLPDSHWLEEYAVQFLDSGRTRSTNPFLPTLRTNAAIANDEGSTFAEIADAIEACAEGV
jgi:hypothetical protein